MSLSKTLDLLLSTELLLIQPRKKKSIIACFQILLKTTILYCDFVYANVLSYEVNIVKLTQEDPYQLVNLTEKLLTWMIL